MSVHTAVVVILNYNGKHFLEKFLPGVVANSAPFSVVVADNASTDGSTEFLTTHFPSVRVIQTGGNHGYAGGYNIALSMIEADTYVLLNNDVETPAGWLTAALALMQEDPSAGACQPLILDYNNRDHYEYAGAAGGFIDRFGYPFCRGRLFNTLETLQPGYNTRQEIFWASGACMFVNANAFRAAGGFDTKYFAHMEEIDLCWRMKNIGYRIFAEPASQIYHVGGGTLHKVSPHKTFLNFRNNLTTLTKNSAPLTLPFKLLLRLILDGIAALKFLFGGEAPHLAAVFKAHFAFYAWIPRIIKERRILRKMEGFRYSRSSVYRGSIVFEYYILKKRTFSSLGKRFFPDQK